MELIKLLNDRSNNHQLIQIDLHELSKNPDLLEDIYDIIAIELRKNEESLSWEEAKLQLTNLGKI